MWKAALLVVALMVAGHFAVRYLRTNPLAPTVEGGELVVETSEHVVRFALEGAVEGTYLVAKAESQDYGVEPANAKLSVVNFATAREYLSGHPDQVGYGSISEQQLENLAAPLALIAGNLLAYGDLHALIDRYEARAEDGGKWLCVTISGEALGATSAESSASGVDATALFVNRTNAQRVWLATRLKIADCEKRLAGT